MLRVKKSKVIDLMIIWHTRFDDAC